MFSPDTAASPSRLSTGVRLRILRVLDLAAALLDRLSQQPAADCRNIYASAVSRTFALSPWLIHAWLGIVRRKGLSRANQGRCGVSPRSHGW